MYRAGTPPQLLVRPIDQLDATPIAGTANARAPFISPDGRWVGYFLVVGGNSEIEKVSIAGGRTTRAMKAAVATRVAGSSTPRDRLPKDGRRSITTTT